MSKSNFLQLFAILVLLLIASVTQALELASILQDHMVLQRNETIRLNGWAQPGEKVIVRFNKYQYEALAKDDGKWLIKIKPHKAGGPFAFSFSSAEQEIKLKDIYFGDVWLASGQSNMEWKLGWHTHNWQAEIKDSYYPLIRYFDVPNRFSATPQERIENSSWHVSSPETVGNYSAVAWFFAKHALFEKNVAIGIIDATWGGTAAEPWTPIKTLAAMKPTQKASKQFSDQKIDWQQRFDKDQFLISEKERRAYNTDGFRLKNTASEKLVDNNWNTVTLPNQEPLKDIVWLRKKIDLDAQTIDTLKDVRLQLGSHPQSTRFYINNKLAAEKTFYEQASIFNINPKLFKTGPNTLAIRMVNTWNNKSRIGKKDNFWISFNTQKMSLAGTWKWNNSVEEPIILPQNYWQDASTLYNGMIHPILGYDLKGIIWYQGESNTKRASAYHEVFSGMIKSWRELWQDEDLPFLFVQLAGFRKIPDTPRESKWAELREAQTETLQLKNTGMAVAIDAGDTYDIHPRNKQIIGERLWQTAKVIAYGDKGLASGPMAESIKVKGQKLIISYKYTGKELKAKGTLKGFELAGKDGKYYFANAFIKGKKIIVSSNKVIKPQSVRYAWADNSNANLYNSEDLPAIPFRMGEKPLKRL